MLVDKRGSTWKKWDLHVHTPNSLVHNYPGDREKAWEQFISELEALPPDFKVIGINDYLFVDGYKRVLEERKRGRISNIELILPVIELRMDKFGGVLSYEDRKYTDSDWSRINLHVIFDEVEPELIQEQFISAISSKYKLVADVGTEWGGVITYKNLIALGNAIINSTPENLRRSLPSPLKLGFNNLNVTYEGFRDALKNPHLAGKYVVAIGKTEWENLRWSDRTIADKKSTINEADLVFISAENPAHYSRARESLQNANVNDKLLDCSDAHSFSSSGVKDRIGNCFTWIKADSSFQGLLQAIAEFDERVFVGDIPPKQDLVGKNKTKFIDSVQITKKESSKVAQHWFDVNLPLNPDLVAIIGNKGSGKSALADIIALAGNTQNSASFSFLSNSRFRNRRDRFAEHFTGKLIWKDGTETYRELNKDPEVSDVERVKYLPQSYLEQLCNELGDSGSDTFDSELRKIIYSHVPEEDRLGKNSMDDLLDYKLTEINQACNNLRISLNEVNKKIVNIDNRLTPEFKKGLEEKLTIKQIELNAHTKSKPEEVENPNDSKSLDVNSKRAVLEVECLEKELENINHEKNTYIAKKSSLVKKQVLGDRIVKALENYKTQHSVFIEELSTLLSEIGNYSAQSLIQLTIHDEFLGAIVKEVQNQIRDIDFKLDNDEEGSIKERYEKTEALIIKEKLKLNERQRQYVLYKEALAQWKKERLDIVASVEWLNDELISLESLPQQLDDLKIKRIEITRKIYQQLQSMVSEYERLYEPVQFFVNSADAQVIGIPLEFQVEIEEEGFEDQFLRRLNRQVRGTYSGIEEGKRQLSKTMQETSFIGIEEVVNFVERIEQSLYQDEREDYSNRETRLSEQMRKEVTPVDMLDFVFGLSYLSPRYSLTYEGQEIGQLSPGERGLLLLVFYLLVDKSDVPLIIDQPEENLDNQTIYTVLVKCIKRAKERRQVIMVTHNPNLAVVCDAEQIIYASCDKKNTRFNYEAGAIENSQIRNRVVEILEGTEPAFKNRQSKYRLS